MKEREKLLRIINEYKNPDNELEARCVGTAASIYGDPFPPFVLDRMTAELSSIRVNGWASHYLIASDTVNYSRQKGYMVTNRGMLPSSLVAFLCGISEVNPLPAHYRCPSCHHVEIIPMGDNYRLCGPELIDKECPDCGSEMIADGFDILPEVCMGLHLDQEPDFILNFAPDQRKDVLKFFKTKVKKEQIIRAGVKVELEDGSTRRGVHPGGIYIIPQDADITDLTTLREPEQG